MEKILVTVTENFFDGHGSPDNGSVYKFITEDQNYKIFEKDFYYRDYELWDFDGVDYTISEFLEENKCEQGSDDHLYAQDGYHTTAYSVYWRVITDEQAIEYQEIIDKYNKI